MKTIVERAMERFPMCVDETYEHNVLAPLRNCYINTAKEQKEIDIQRACEWLENNIHDAIMRSNIVCNFIQAMRED